MSIERVRAVGATLLALLLTACGATGSAGNEAMANDPVQGQSGRMAPPPVEASPGQANEASPSDPGVAIPTWPWRGLSASARLSGKLVLRGRCLAVDGGSGDPILLAFPPGRASWDPAGRALLFDGRRYRLDEDVVLTGGGQQRSDSSVKVTGLPDECPGEHIWLAG